MMDIEDSRLAAVLASLRDEVEEPPAGFRDRLAARLRRDLRWREPVRRAVHDRRARYAAASVGGAVLGAAAIGLIWWRSAKRPDRAAA